MASKRQLAANRSNAQRSTGPRTEEGKSVSRLNALKHGLTSDIVVMQGEDYAAYQELRGSLLTSYQPANPQEQMLVEQLAAAYWRGRRMRRLETEAFETQVAHIERRNEVKLDAKGKKHAKEHASALAIAFTVQPEEMFKTLFRYDAAIERAFFRNLQHLEKLQAQRRRQEREQANAPKDTQPAPERNGNTNAPLSPQPPAPTVAGRPIRFVPKSDRNGPANQNTSPQRRNCSISGLALFRTARRRRQAASRTACK